MSDVVDKKRMNDFNRIANGIKRWRFATVEAVKLVAEAHEKEIWKMKYDSFKEFLEKECGISKQWGYELLQIAEVTKQIGPSKSAELKPKHLSELAKVDPEKRTEVLAKAESTGKLTAKSIKKAAKEAKLEILDKTGYPIPEHLQEAWNLAEELGRGLTRQISEVRTKVKYGLESQDILYHEVPKSIIANLNNAYTDLKSIIPYAVCPTCQANKKTKCNLCKNSGMLSEFGYFHWVPEETRKVREAK